jgi:hypothetical protein
MKQRKTKPIRSLIAAFAVAALVVPPVAQARIDSQRSQRPTPARVSTTIARADERAGVRGPGSTQTPRLVSSTGAGFDWKDASLGGTAALVAVVILTSGVVISRRDRGDTVAV